MTCTENWNEPYLTAADAMAAARDAADMLRNDLPALLGTRLASSYTMLARRFEEGPVLDPPPPR